MARRKLVPLTYRGLGLNTIGRTVYFDYDEGAFDTPRRDSISVERIGRFPRHVREQPQGKTFPLRVAIKVCDTQQQFEAITKILNPDLGPQLLRLQDLGGQRYRLTCHPQQAVLEQRSDHPFVIPLWAADPFLEDDTETSTPVEVPTAGNPATLSIRNIGTAQALPILEVIPRQLKTTAQSYRTVREITYANRSEFPLTGPGSGTWMLMVIDNWDTAALIAGGQMQSDGDDIAVFVDNVQVPPEKVVISGINTTTTKVWVEISDAPAQFGTLIKPAIVAGTTNFDFETADHGLQIGDYLVWQNTALAYESAKVTAIDGANITVTRGARSTVAGAAAVGTRMYRSGHHIQLAYNWSAATTRPVNPDPPLISTLLSTNLRWDWPTGPIWPDQNRRAGGWRRIIYDGREDVPELRKNKLSAKTALDLSGTDVRFADVEPTASRPNFDALEFRACCGVDDVLGAIEYDSDLGWPYCLQVIGRDLLGLDSIIFNRLGHETGAAHFPPRLYTNQQETPPGILSAVILRGRQCIVTTCRPGDSFEEDLAVPLTSGHDVQGFRLDEDAQIIGIVLRARHETAGTVALRCQIVKADNDVPDTGKSVAGPFSGAGGLGAVLRPVCFFPSPAAAFTTDVPVVPAGDFFLEIGEVAGTGNIRTVRSNLASIYARGTHWEHDGTSYIEISDEDLWFALLSLNADNQDDAIQAERTGETLLLRNLTIIFDPARTPIVDPRAAENAYYFDDIWTRSTSTENVRLRYLKRWVEAQDNIIRVDIKERTVTDVQLGEEIRATLTMNGDPWLTLQPGANLINIEASGGAVEEDHTIRHRGTWQT